VTGELPEHDMTRATARLPGLEIEITHRKSPDAERISIHLQATPSFDAFGRFFEAANPFMFWAQGMQQGMQQAMQMAWLPWSAWSTWSPWLNATPAMTPTADANETQRKLLGR
jgi:hypothetical protein